MMKTIILLLKNIYHRLPISFGQRLRIKRFFIRRFPKIMSRLLFGNTLGDSLIFQGAMSSLIHLTDVRPAKKAPGRIAIHLHIFYQDLIQEFVRYLKNMPFEYDLFISVVSEESYNQCEADFKELTRVNDLLIKIVPNQGRDIAPFFCTFGEQLKKYDLVGHFHTKKSLYNQGATDGWREYLLDSLLGDAENIKRIFSLFEEDEPYGLVYPQTYFLLPYQAHTWLANKGLGDAWCARLGFADVPRGYFDYPAGSMFWAKSAALMPLFEAGITINDFPTEAGQSDGTLAHTLERLTAISSINTDYKLGILSDTMLPSWSPWRLEQYTNRTYADLQQRISNPEIKVVGFDLFDTLFCRPLLDPETTKQIVAARVDEHIGTLYRDFRAISEDQARTIKTRDVGLDEVFAQLKKLTEMGKKEIQLLRGLEEKIEVSDLLLRKGIQRLYQDVLGTGKKIILVSDTTLPREILSRIIDDFGIHDWDAFFVSSEVGLRKDSGELYEHLFQHYKIRPDEFLMIGDNERSDYQIPIDMGAEGIHLMRPVEMARGLPRLSRLVHETERSKNLNDVISFGLVVRKNFSPILLPDFDPASLFTVEPGNIGYSLVGPLLASFCSWLVDKAQQDGVKRLYFLSREGKLIKRVYDCWAGQFDDAPSSEYLVLSRRTTGVAAVRTIDDIENIAKTNFYPNRTDKFLSARFGLDFSKEKWAEITAKTGFAPDMTIEIQNGNIGVVSRLLRYLEADILSKAGSERHALINYLEAKGLNFDSCQAVVDIGYSGTVQGHLNKLLSQQVHGYYLMTDERSKNVSTKYQVLIRGCFDENITPSVHLPVMYRDSFLLEKLLSSKDEQIEFYELDEQQRPVGHFRALANLEIKAHPIKDEIEAGCLRYMQDTIRVRKTLFPDFSPSTKIGRALIEEFLVNLSERENVLLSQIVLDDYYCGRDLVM